MFLEDIVTLSKWWSEEVVGLAVYAFGKFS